MKNCIFILLWCIPGFLFSVTPKPDVEKLTETADTYYQAGKVDSALWAIEQALQLAMTEKDTCAMLSCYTSQGVYLRSSGKLTEAIAAYDKALQYAPLLSGNNEENLQAITTLYNNLATVYLDMKNPAQAVKYALDAVKQADKCQDKSFRTQIYTVCSSIFITQEEYEAAKTYLSKAIALSQQLQQPETELGARTYYLLTLFRTQASASEIQKLVEQTNALAAKVNSTMALVNYYQVLFYVQQTRKEWKAATQTAQKILQLPGIENYPFLQYDVYNNLHLVYKELSEFPQAYHTLELAKALSDSLFVQEKSRQLEELSVKYETQKKELEYQKLQEKRQKEKQNLQLKITFLLILMAIMAFVSLYFIQKQKLRIERQKREAEAQKREFETLQRPVCTRDECLHTQRIVERTPAHQSGEHPTCIPRTASSYLPGNDFKASITELCRTDDLCIMQSHPDHSSRRMRLVCTSGNLLSEHLPHHSGGYRQCAQTCLPHGNPSHTGVETSESGTHHFTQREIQLYLRKRYRATNYERKSDGNERTHFS